MEQKNALVFGGTGGIGRELSLLLAADGVSVTACGTRDSYDGMSGVSIIRADADDVLRSSADGACPEPLLAALEAADILCVCYGPFVQKSVHGTSAADWQLVALHDYALPGILVSAALPGMMRRSFGRILLFGGTRTEAVRACRTNAAYAGAKTGLSVIVRSVAAEYARWGITCNGILPGFVTGVPEGASPVSARQVAKEALHLISSPELTGVLLQVGQVPF